jgi:nucleoside-diphosphate-sugar epimerase
MRLLITGAGGFLGSHVLALLRQQGVPAWTLGRTQPKDWPGIAHVTCDLLAGDDCAASLRTIAPSHLLHLAWVTDHAHYQTSPLNTEWLRATQTLTRAFTDAGGRHLVVAGTCAEYDWSQGWCHEETTPLAPAVPYGVAKDGCRQWLQDHAAAHGLRMAWGRIFFPFGTGQSAQRLIPALVSALQGRQAIFPVQAMQRRDFVSAPDVAQALWTLLQAPAGGCYNISSAQPVAIGELVRMLARLLGVDPTPVLVAAAAGVQAPALVAGDNRRLRAFGWAGPAPLVDCLATMLGASAALPVTHDTGPAHDV